MSAVSINSSISDSFSRRQAFDLSDEAPRNPFIYHAACFLASLIPVSYTHLGIDVMTTETACWSSIWKTDLKVKDYLAIHGRESDYSELNPEKLAYYDGMIELDLSTVEPMIALPFHPSNVYSVSDLIANSMDILNEVEKAALSNISNKNLSLGLLSKVRAVSYTHLITLNSER